MEPYTNQFCTTNNIEGKTKDVLKNHYYKSNCSPFQNVWPSMTNIGENKTAKKWKESEGSKGKWQENRPMTARL